ncbi:MAG: hypothetical protein KGI54_14900 [Pseudomonadota bacterium]|nr:hypothetical protein [Pseudomonadota bacterium]
MTILVDFNAVVIASVARATSELPIDILDLNACKNYFFNDIIRIKKKFPDHGEIVICCDSKNYWRKDFYPFYKIGRKELRADSPLDWNLVSDTINGLHDDIKEYFPYKVIKVDKCEADDVIAVLSKFLAGYHNGLCSKSEPIMIISSDGDFKQLQVIPTLRQYSLAMEKEIIENDPETFLYEKILKGDLGDGVVNVLSEDDALALKIRQKPITAVRIAKWKQYHVNTGCLHEDLDVRKYNRNKQLMDLLNEIPMQYENEIVEMFLNSNPVSKLKTGTYFIKNRMKNLHSELSYF